MPRTDFDALPEHGRVWVFPASRRLNTEEEAALLDEVDAFLDGWAAHGDPLLSGRSVVEGQFLLVGVDEDASRPSGCSIDALVNRLEALATGLGIRLVEHAPVWYRDGGGVRAVSREAFRELAAAGTVTPETRVFDTTLTRLADLRRGGLERPAAESWHGRAFFRSRQAG
ncbi:MAG: hypothetical protein AMXMBFR53_24090 [Gemmatimonadota bacterium]